MRGPVTKTCERCGQSFECVGYQCWCGTIGITDQQMDWIAARFKDCLCPACLQRVSMGERGPQESSTDQRKR
ncbi:MAG: cysteine-rich CWC family protein [Nitrospira sp.]|nr:cysteine-rich CWC family protein [Nitrospira sp.]MBK9948716.1 cysteine-rich CWC family protein [Nitrospira sp.]